MAIIRVEYIDPIITFMAESPAAPTFYDECNWKSYERIDKAGDTGRAKYIDDVDSGGGGSDAG